MVSQGVLGEPYTSWGMLGVTWVQHSEGHNSLSSQLYMVAAGKQGYGVKGHTKVIQLHLVSLFSWGPFI